MNTGKVILCIVAGAAAGAILGTLFAPSKGSVTRKKLSKKGYEFAEELKERFTELEDNIQKKIEDVKDEVKKFANKASNKLTPGK